MGESLLIREELPQENPVAEQADAVGIGEGPDFAELGGGPLPLVQAAGDLQHGPKVLLGGIDRRGQLGIAEHIHDPVVADAVPGAEILVGIVVEGAPADAAGDAIQGIHGVQHRRVAQGMGQAVRFVVEGLCGEHVAVVLRHQVGGAEVVHHLALFRQALVIPPVDEIIIGIHVLQQMAVADAADAPGLPGGVQGMGPLIGAPVEGVVVRGLVDAHAPEDHAGMAAVLPHHIVHVPHGLLLPVLPADMLPAGDLREDQKAQLVAAVQEGLGLGIVGGAHHIQAQLLPQDLRVPLLHIVGHGVAHIGIGLMPVQAPEGQLFPIEEEALRAEFRIPEAEAHAALVQLLSRSVQQHRRQGIEVRLLRAPALRAGAVQAQAAAAALPLPYGQARRQGQGIFGGLGQLLLDLPQDIPLPVGDAQEHVRPRARLRKDRISGLAVGVDKEVRQEAGAGEGQAAAPVDALIGEIVDLIAEGGLVQALPGIQLQGQEVLPFPGVFRELRREAGVAAAVGQQGLPVEEEAAALGRPVEMDKKAAAPIQRRQGQLFPIAGQILIIQLLRVVIGQKGAGMGQAHALRLRLPAQEEGFRGLSGKFPTVVERYAPGHVFISPQSLP